MMRVAGHLCAGLLTVRLHFSRWSPAQRSAAKQAWSAGLLDCLGIRRTDSPVALPEAALIVSNHVSWLDVFVLNAVTRTHFVCKEEVRAWPVIGWLVEHTNTIFIARGSRAAAARTARALVETLRRGERVAVFPEGTTTDGRTLQPFKSALFQAAVDAPVPIFPIALRYHDARGELSTAPAYDGDISLWQCMWNIALAPAVHVDIRPLAELPAALGRRELAEHCWRLIARGLGMPSPVEASPTYAGESGEQATWNTAPSWRR